MIAIYPKALEGIMRGKEEVVVKNEDEHQRLYPQHYAKMKAQQEGDPTKAHSFIAAASAAEERERCAIVAETYPKAGRIGQQIAAVIRGQVASPGLYPKVLRNPETSPVAVGKFTLPGPDPETFVQPDVTVDDATEEAVARAEGFTVTVSQAQVPGLNASPAAAIIPYPKVLRDPTSKPMPDTRFTQPREGNRFGKPDVSVQDAVEERQARSEGFIELVSPVPEL